MCIRDSFHPGNHFIRNIFHTGSGYNEVIVLNFILDQFHALLGGADHNRNLRSVEEHMVKRDIRGIQRSDNIPRHRDVYKRQVWKRRLDRLWFIPFHFTVFTGSAVHSKAH